MSLLGEILPQYLKKFPGEGKMQEANSGLYKTNSWPFILFNGVFCVLLFAIWLDIVLYESFHPLYDGTSIWFVLLASLVVLAMAAQRSLVLQILSVLLTCFYTQRVVVTYFVPESFDFSYYGFTAQNIQDASRFYFFCTLFILLGSLILRPFLSNLLNSVLHNAKDNYSRIRFFTFRVDFLRLCRTALWVIIIGYCYKFIAMIITGFGLTGSIYSSNETVFKWSLQIADALSPFVLFSLVYFSKGSRERKLAAVALVLVVLNGFFIASKGFLLGLMVSYYLIMRLIGRKLPVVFFVKAALVILFSILVFFPAMTMFRSALLYGGLTFNFNHYCGLLSHAFLSFSYRLGGFDWMTLWLSVPRSEIPSNATAMGELIVLINRLIPGELIAQPSAINLAKLQGLLGHGWGNLHELGGNGGDQGGLATAYIFFGKITGLAYLAFWAGGLTALEKVRVHPFHKVTILTSYLVTFMIGGGFVLMHGSFFWYLVFTTFLVLVLSFVKSRVKKNYGQAHRPRNLFLSAYRDTEY